jgi:uncharacterized membrane protein YfcA
MDLSPNTAAPISAAPDERERKQLRLLRAAETLNYAVFGLGMLALGPRGHGSHTRLWIGTTEILAFTALHLAIYLVWRPRVRARRWRQEELVDPSAAARHVRDARIGVFGALFGTAIVAAIVIAAWTRG